MALTGRAALLALVAALVVGVLDPHAGGVLAATLAVLAVAVLDAVLAAAPRMVAITRAQPLPVRLGSRSVTTLAVRNDGPRQARGLLRDAWVPSAGLLDARRRLDVPPGQIRVLAFELTPSRRGERRSDRVTVRCLGPLGVAGRQRSILVPGTLRVLPEFASRRHLPARLAALRELEGRSPVAVRGEGTEFDNLRGYIPGDDVRSIDWRASARGGGVAVRTWRPERDRVVHLVLDSGRTSAGRLETPAGPATRLDVLLDAALLLGAIAGHAGDRVGLSVVDSAVRAEVRTGRRAALAELTAALTTVEPRLVSTDFALLARTVLTRVPQRALLVLLTGLDRPVVEDGLLPVLGALTRRHHVVVAAVDDPETARARSSDEATGTDGAAGTTVEAVYAAAAAEREALDRAGTAALLSRAGVTVLDAGPDELAPRLADLYLMLKRTGRLG